MKKFIIGFLAFNIFAGITIVSADFVDAVNNAADAVESVAEKTGEFSRNVTEFNLKLEYFARPYSEKDLTFAEWLDLHGYTTIGAGPIPTGSFSLPEAEEFGEVGANTNLRSFLLNVTNWVLSFLGLICIIMIIYAGYLCIIVGGEDGNEKCKKILIYVVVGVIVILVSYALVNTIIKSTVEGGDNYSAISVSRNAVHGNISVTGGNALSYGQVVLLDSGAVVTFTAEAPTSGNYSAPDNLQWSFGDNSIVVSNNGTNSVERTFFDDGFKEIVVIGKIIETVDGVEIEHDYVARQKVLVGPNVVANFTILPVSPRVNDTVHFDARNSQALVGTIDSFSWDCSPSNLCAGFTNVNDNELDAVFDTAGTVTVTLTVTPNPGASATFSKTFEVLPPSVTSSIQAKFNVSSSTPIVNNSVHFVGMALPAGTVPDNFTWECFPMGTTNVNICTDFNANASGNLDFYAIFSEVGNAKISLTVEKNGEISAPFERVIHVVNTATYSRGFGGNDINLNVPSAARVTESVQLSASTTNSNYTNFRWTLPNEVKTGDVVTTVFQDVGSKNITLEALDDNGNVAETLSRNVLVVEQGVPIPGLKINGEAVYPGSTINILLGENLNFQTNSADSSGNTGASANVTHSWVLDGTVVNENMLSGISAKIGTYSLKLNAISSLDPNKRSSLQFKIKVNRKAPKINLEVRESSLGKGFYKLKAQVDTEGTPKRYKFEVLEKGKVVATQIVNSTDKNVETIIDLSNKVGEHNYVFQVLETETDGAVAKKIVNKSVRIDATEVVNNEPIVEIFTTPATNGLTSTMFRFYVQADDLDNDFLTYKWEFPNGKKVLGKTANHRFETPGKNEVKVIVSDGITEVEATEVIDVVDDPNYHNNNHAPSISSSGMSPGNTGNTETVFKFYALAEDVDGDELEYSWSLGDGNVINLQNISYQYSTPGKYSAKLSVSDGVKTVTKLFSVTVVKVGEEIPPSTIEDYELTHDISQLGFDSGQVAIGSTLTSQNIAEFADQITSALENATPEEATLMQDILSLIDEYNRETDPLKKKTLLYQINQKRLELEILNAELNFKFVGLEGTVNTKFFFYGKIPQSNRPVLIKWQTGDGREFIGQNVAWKYSQPGDYIVQMEVSDGISVATDTINIRINP